VAAPDGDADVDAIAIERFSAPRCESCGGLLKPDVVFFGENVPVVRYEDARDALAGAEALLVAGSSLMVFSGFRFVRQAHEAGVPIAIVNRGRTRGDELADLKVEGDVGTILTQVLDV
jgi:NAD-dependent SIR2 family protein deacetylase